MRLRATLVAATALSLIAVVAYGQTVTGSGKAGTIPVWVGTSKLGNSLIVQSGKTVNIGASGGPSTLNVAGTSPIAAFGTGSGIGVAGHSVSNYGILGVSTSSRGVVGQSSTKSGVVGMSTSGDGAGGIACSGCSGAAGLVGIGKLAGSFSGTVGVAGNLVVTGVKAFHIDHPLDPANKYLNHAAVESNEVLNVYSGNAITDLGGMATIVLPDYFSVLNGDYRYQLTVVGQFAQAIVFREIENNTFVIKTDKPSVKVSWQVTGVRQDAWMKNHPLQIEEDKPEKERGYYLHPELFGQPEEKGLFWLYHNDLMRDAKALWSHEKTSSE
jgi:trimeric autotransporter adhesin